MTSAHIAEAVAWFAEHEADRRGVDGSPYERLKRTFNLSFAEAVQVCREVRKLVGPYPSTPWGGDHQFRAHTSWTALAAFFA
ncbi:hypothetical protein CK218_10845 [Mesorhizobium sp. WSM3879]|nr:hypothetical protein CK218_10845 [Mesorhizobium sp. WSM3879]